MVTAFEGRRFEKLNEIIARHGRSLPSLIPILQNVQEEYRYLPEEVLTYVATALGLPPSAVFGVATFYAQFSTEPKGRYVVKVCNGTACHVRGSDTVHYSIRRAIGLEPGQKTTPDLAFTVERVACVGACSMAPVVTVNDSRVLGEMTQKEAAVLAKRLKEEAATDGTRPEADAAAGGVPAVAAGGGSK